jgi:hypothetical protein
LAENPWEKLPKKINFNHWENQVFVGQLQHLFDAYQKQE